MASPAVNLEEACSICLEELCCWPTSGELADATLGITLLPCGHVFHRECLHARDVHLVQGSGRQLVERSSPLLRGACPNCRAPWQPTQAQEFILADLEERVDCGESSEAEEDAACHEDADRSARSAIVDC